MALNVQRYRTTLLCLHVLFMERCEKFYFIFVLFYLFVVKMALNVQPYRTTPLCIHVLCMERCEK